MARPAKKADTDNVNSVVGYLKNNRSKVLAEERKMVREAAMEVLVAIGGEAGAAAAASQLLANHKLQVRDVGTNAIVAIGGEAAAAAAAAFFASESSSDVMISPVSAGAHTALLDLTRGRAIGITKFSSITDFSPFFMDAVMLVDIEMRNVTRS